ncbi:SseB family protein [Campylobacter sp. Marseille-Q3452]|uniref:SseB family protein n=1 Tax=Campylobacter massiliensis TaxID=2762557 RepID=A0A842J5S4_9BACT|nr:SseB family protein [Campylobacter massiliensis]MBC2881935.1 SseB family protein [Campylobacter massiliensis]
MNENLNDFIDAFLLGGGEQSEKALIAALKKTEFLAPVLINQALAKPDGSAVYEEEGSNIKFVLLEDEESGLSYFPAFSSRGEMMRWRNDAEQEAINLRLKDYAAMLDGAEGKYAGVVIDAFSHSLILDLAKLKAICAE